MKFKDYYEALGVERGATQDDIKQGLPQARAQVPPRRQQAWPTPRRASRRSTRPTRSCRTRRSAPPTTRWAATARAGQDSSRRRAGTPASSSAAAAPSARRRGRPRLRPERLLRGAVRPPRRERPARGARRPPARSGEDHHAKVLIDLEDALPRRATQHLAARAGRRRARPRRAAGAHARRQHPEGHPRRASTCASRARARRASAAGRPATCTSRSSSTRTASSASTARDVYVDLPVAPWEAALGATVDVPTPRGHRGADDPQGLAGRPQAAPEGSRIAGQDRRATCTRCWRSRCRRPRATPRAPPTRRWPRPSPASTRARICKDELS